MPDKTEKRLGHSIVVATWGHCTFDFLNTYHEESIIESKFILK